MKCSKRSFAVVSPLFAVLLSLSIGTLNARDADLASRTIAAAQTAKRKCINTCRTDQLAGKAVELLKDAAPWVSRVAILWNPNHTDPEYRKTQRAARTLSIEL